MHKLLTIVLLACLTGCGPLTQTADSAQTTSSAALLSDEEEETMQILVRSVDYAVIYELDHSQAAQELYKQLPLSLTVENFSTNEKVFYPPKKLDISDVPLADAAQGAGVLAYYAPWGDVVMFYDDFSSNSSLYALGEAVSGQESIAKLTGMITVSAYEEAGDQLHD